MDLFVYADPQIPAHVRPAPVVMALIVLCLVISLIGFFYAIGYPCPRRSRGSGWAADRRAEAGS